MNSEKNELILADISGVFRNYSKLRNGISAEKAVERIREILKRSEASTPDILYLCDGFGCSACCGGKNEYCKHTSHVEHAANFTATEPISGKGKILYYEGGHTNDA